MILRRLFTQRTTAIGICLFLAGINWLVFGQTLSHDFVNFDDETYVYGNTNVIQGLSFRGIAWAFTHVVSSNWHPLTLISHMLDCQLYGSSARGPHLTNVLLHTIAVILLFLVLWQMTGAIWRSSFVAAIFGVHPLRVESVAWVAERKDILSALVFMLILAAYVRYVRRPGLARYLTVLLLFSLGLMCKPMLVTVPIVLLLLDYWPLKRLTQPDSSRSKDFGVREQLSFSWRLVREKIPLLILSIASSFATLLAQRSTINTVEELSLSWRLGNAVVTYLTYIRQFFWPVRLSVFYPHPRNTLPPWEIVLSIVLVIAISAAVWVMRQRRRYLLTGWAWYLTMLLPVIGVVQVGLQAHADRYTYLPQIGLSLLTTWAISDLSASWRHQKIILGSMAMAALIGSIWCARIQTSYWKDSITLWRRAVAVTAGNDRAHNALCGAFLEKDRVEEAISEARIALSIRPTSAEAHSNLGAALSRNGKSEEALAHLFEVLKVDPNRRRLHFNIATTLLQKGEVDEAIVHYQEELRIQPDFAEAHNNLASLLLRKGRPAEAETHLRRALELRPNYGQARNNLAITLSQEGRMSEAIVEWEKTLSIQPNDLDAQCNLAWVFATHPDASIRDGRKALSLAQHAVRLSGETNPRILRLLAAAEAENGRFSEAIEVAQKAWQLANTQGDVALARLLEKNIASFQANSPLRDVGESGTRSSRQP